MKRLGFHAQHFSERGTSIAIYDYADHYEKLCNGRSVIFFKRDHEISCPEVEKRFKERFEECYGYSTEKELEALIATSNIKKLYHLVYGTPCWLPSNCENLVHAVFYPSPFGNRYAAISEMVSRGTVPVVPHMVHLPSVSGDLREELGIPSNAIVVGRHGGYDSFNVPFVFSAMKRALDLEPRLHFILLNTVQGLIHPRVHYLEKTWNVERKVRFIQSCDIMLHARIEGETFGLAVAEFSICNKPVLTCPANDYMHILILGERAHIYWTEEQLTFLLLNVPAIVSFRKDWNAYENYTPEKVMKTFETIFLN